jgi:hypothetical protein
MRAIILFALIAISWTFFARASVANSATPAMSHVGDARADANAPESLQVGPTLTGQVNSQPEVHSPQTIEQIQFGALADQNKMLKEFQSSLLSTVWWALGVVVALALGLGGFSWFSTHKLYDSDKRALRDEFNQSIEDVQAKVSSTLALKLAESISSVDKLLQTTLSETRTKMIGIDEDQVAFKDEITKLQSEVAYTHAEMRMTEFRIWETKGIPINMLVTLSQALEAITKTDRAWYVKHVFGDMKKVMKEHFIDVQTPIAETARTRIKARIEAAGRLDEVGSTELLQLLAEIPTE